MTNRLLALGLGVLWAAATLQAQITVKGNASYYSDRLHGRRMSNGDRYHKDSLTCAHLTYPLGTMLKVRNPLNNKEVIVKVTDRGPHTKRFLIDLSRASARELDIIQAGFSMVEITPYHPGVVPFRLEPEDGPPVLYLEYLPCVTFPLLPWQNDSLFKARAKVPKQIVKVKADGVPGKGKAAPAGAGSRAGRTSGKPASADPKAKKKK